MDLALLLRNYLWKFVATHLLINHFWWDVIAMGKMTRLGVSGNFVHIFEVTPKIATLGERFLAQCTRKWSLPCVLSEVISQIAALLEHTFTPWVSAFEIKFDALCVQVLHLNGFMPLFRDSWESLGFNARHAHPLFRELRLETQVRRALMRVLMLRASF